MVPPNKRDPIRVPNLESKQKQESLNRVVPPINEVPQKKVIPIRTLSTHFEELYKVVELPVDVTAYGHRGVDTLHIRLVDENLAGFLTEDFHLGLPKVLTTMETLDLGGEGGRKGLGLD